MVVRSFCLAVECTCFLPTAKPDESLEIIKLSSVCNSKLDCWLVVLLERVVILHVKGKVLDYELVDDVFRNRQESQELFVFRNLPFVGFVVNLGLNQGFNLLLLCSSRLDLRQQVLRPVICREVLTSQVSRHIFCIVKHVNNQVTQMSQICFLKGFITHFSSFEVR